MDYAVSLALSLNKIAMVCRSNISQVNTTKNTVPVRAITLRFPQFLHPAIAFTDSTSLINFLMDSEHLLVHLIYLRVLDQKITPQAAVHESSYVPMLFSFKLTFNISIFPRFIGWQRPLQHLIIRSTWQIHSALRRKLMSIFTKRNGVQPILVGFRCSKKPVYPSLLPAIVMSSRPDHHPILQSYSLYLKFRCPDS